MTVLAEVDGPDVLTDVLATLRLQGRLFCRSELAAPWSLALQPGDFAHFHVVERGGCWLRLAGDERPRPLAAGDVVVLPHGQGHTLADSPETPPVPMSKLLEGARGPAGCAVVRHGGGGPETLLICGSFRFEGSRTHPLLSLLPPLVHVQGDGGPATRTTEWLQTTLRFLAAEARHPRPGAETLISRLTDVIFVQVLRAWIEAQPEGAGGWLGALRDRQIAAALGHVHRVPESDWSVGSLASAVGMSRSSFAARFTALVGESPLAYVTRWRMHLASELLRRRDLSVSEVAGRVGYDSEAAFSKAFKREVGVPPGALRRSGVAPDWPVSS